MVFWTFLSLASDLANLDRSSRYDEALQSRVKEDTGWRLPIDDAYRFGNRVGVTTSSRDWSQQGRISGEVYDSDVIEDYTSENFEQPANRSAGFTLKLKFPAGRY